MLLFHMVQVKLLNLSCSFQDDEKVENLNPRRQKYEVSGAAGSCSVLHPDLLLWGESDSISFWTPPLSICMCVDLLDLRGVPLICMDLLTLMI